ncbi:MAG: hypothetical protein ACKO23_03735, partial [Gemmataceae bacterium]
MVKSSRSLKQATAFRLEALEDRTLPAVDFGFAYAMGDNSSLSNRSQAWDIALDLDGNTVITGAFQGTVNFNPRGPSAFNLTSSSSSATDIFVAKYDPFGAMIWAKGFGGSLYDEGYGVITDNDGNVYATGYFQGTVSFGGSSLTSEGVSDAFIIKLSGADGSTTWAQHYWGYDTSLNNYGEDLDVDIWGNVYTCGIYDGPYGQTNPENMFLLKLDSAGNYLWYGEFEGTGLSDASNVAVDEWGQVYFSGSFSNTMDFDMKAGDFNLTSRGKTDVFLAKYDTAGNFLWAESWGGTEADRGYALILDGMANAYVSGSFQGTAQMDPANAGYTGPFALTSLGQDDIFLNKFTDQGVIEWTVHNGGSGDDEGLSLAVDSRSQIYLTGSFQNTATFPVGSANSLTANNAAGNLATFVQKISQEGTTAWVKQLGGY